MGLGTRGISGTTVAAMLVIGLSVAGVIAAELDRGDYNGGDSSGDTGPDHTFVPPGGFERFGVGMDVNGTILGESIAIESQHNVTTYHLNTTLNEWEKDKVFTDYSRPDFRESLPIYEGYTGDAAALNYDPNGVFTPDNVLAFRTDADWGPGHAVTIYERPAGEKDVYGSWDQVDRIQFGSPVGSVALSDNYLAVGLPDADSGNGAVEVFELSAGNHEPGDSHFITEDAGDSEALGFDVAAQGTNVIAGDPTGTWDSGGETRANDPGYAIVIDAITGTVVSVLDKGDGDDQFGQAVDLSSTNDGLAAVGAPASGEIGRDVGIAWRCSGIDTTSVSCEDRRPEEEYALDWAPFAFGVSVKIWDGSMAVGAPESKHDGDPSGRIYVYEEGVIVGNKTAEEKEGSALGASVAWNGDALWGGAPGFDDDVGKSYFWN